MKTKKQPAPQARADQIEALVLFHALELQRGRVAAFGTLRDVYHRLPAGTGIGEMHDAVRNLLANAMVRLHPFTSARYQLVEAGGDYAMVCGGEIMLYIQAL